MSDDQQSGSSQCWWCQAQPPSTREHKYKRTLLERLYGKGAYGRAGPMFLSEEGPGWIRSSNASCMKYGASLCEDCNNRRSKAMDEAMERFQAYVLANEGLIAARRQLDFRRVYPGHEANGIDLLVRAFAKDLACRAHDAGLTVPASLRRLLDVGMEKELSVMVWLDTSVPLVSGEEADLHKGDLWTTDRPERQRLSHTSGIGRIRAFVVHNPAGWWVPGDFLHPRQPVVELSSAGNYRRPQLVRLLARKAGLAGRLVGLHWAKRLGVRRQ